MIIAMLFYSVCIQLPILKHHVSGFHSQNLEGSLIMIRLSVNLFMIHPRFFWEFGVYILEVAMLANMVRQVVQKIHLHKVGI